MRLNDEETRSATQGYSHQVAVMRGLLITVASWHFLQSQEWGDGICCTRVGKGIKIMQSRR